MKELNIKKYSFLIVLLVVCLNINNEVFAQNRGLKKVISLNGMWSFSIGTNDSWTSTAYNDSDWEKIRVPSTWEDQGFQGYNGYGFYRKQVFIPSDLEGQMLYLILGFIDDVDEVYLNGEKIGSTGTFPPNYGTAYNALRKYYIPEDLINYNKRNQIAVKVYDEGQAGGIVSGDIGIYSSNYGLKPDINLQGSWKFKLGDDFDRKKVSYSDENWEKIFVPSKWEDQGYKRYDGYAWYRKTFKYDGSITDKNAIVVLGKIDDCDEVYVNGVWVGSMGEMPKYENKFFSTSQEYTNLRGYYFPAKLLKANQQNIIAVRVFDQHGDGGIYEGPIGIVSQSKYIKYWRKRKESNKW